MFVLTGKEYAFLRSQIGILKQGRGGTRYLHYAFTEHGIATLSSVLKSKKAIQVNIGIIKVCIRLRQILRWLATCIKRRTNPPEADRFIKRLLTMSYKELQKKIEALENKYDKNFEEIYEALKYLLSPPNTPRKKIGYKHYD